MSEIALTTMIAALFSIMNPVGNVGAFASMTASYSASDARKIAWKCAAACAVILLVVIWSGGALLAFFGIDVHQLRAAGGIIVMIIGLQMLFNKNNHNSGPTEKEDAKTRESIAIVPLAIPLVAGPGTIATAIIGAERHSSIGARIDISLAALAICLLVGVLFAYSRSITDRIGASGMAVITRIMGMVLVAIALGMLASGLKVLLPVLAG